MKKGFSDYRQDKGGTICAFGTAKGMHFIMKKLLCWVLILVMAIGLMPILSTTSVTAAGNWAYLESDIFASGTTGAGVSRWTSASRTPFAMGGQTYRRGVYFNALVGILGSSTVRGTYDISGQGFTRLTGMLGLFNVQSSSGTGLVGTLRVTCTDTNSFIGETMVNQGDAPKEVNIDIPADVQRVTIWLNVNVALFSSSSFGFGDAYFTDGLTDGHTDEQAAIRAQRKNNGFPYLQIFDNSGTSNAPSDATLIRDADSLARIGGSQGNYVLANDIQLPGNWRPIEDFRGTLDGAGHVIAVGMNTSAGDSGQGAGLFGTIIAGNVTIRNLGVRGNISARFHMDNLTTQSFNPRSHINSSAGGLIGQVIGGSVTIENCYFDGNLRVSSRQFNVISAIWTLMSGIPSFGIDVGNEVVNEFLDWAVGEVLFDENSHAFAGGLIGKIESGASVTINNSYTRGMVFAYSETTPSIVSSAHSYAGGLVGSIASGSQFSIGNSYSTANVTADTWRNPAEFIGLGLASPRNLHAGGLLGNGNPSATTGNNYRFIMQSVSGSRNRINTAGTPLTRAQMHNQSSFSDWNFDRVWAVDTGVGQEEPSVAFIDGFSAIKDSGAELSVTIDKDISLLGEVSIDGRLLTQNVHFTATRGSTQITLLPSYLGTLEEGFRTLTVTFTDGVSVEEQFVVVASTKEIMPPVNDIYINDTLVFSNGRALVGESFFESLIGGNLSFRVQLADGRVIDQTITGEGLPPTPTQTPPPTPPTPLPIPSIPSLSNSSPWARVELEKAAGLGLITTALQAANVDLRDSITRAEFAALTVRLYETVANRTISTGTNPFNDTSDSNAIKAAAIGVTVGVTPTTFAPHDLLTREQAATMLSRLANALGRPLTSVQTTFADSAQVSSWAFNAVGQVQTTGIMQGVGDNTFLPRGSYTREQSIATIVRTFDFLSGGGTTTPTPTSTPVTGVSLNRSSLSLNVGQTENLSATVAPANATNRNVTWASSNQNVATVSQSGVVTAVAAGSATITVTAVDGSRTATCSVTVNASQTAITLTPFVTDVTVSPNSATIERGDSRQFSASVQGQNNPPQGVSWSVTGNQSTETWISENGLLAVAANETAASLTVRATSTHTNSISGTASVTVTEPTPSETHVIIDGVQYSRTLTTLDLSNRNLRNEDIDPLRYMTNLRDLNLGDNQISDISVLRGLTNLWALNLNNNRVSDISALRDLSNLTWLAAANNQISDISVLSGLSRLENLALSRNLITDWSPVAHIANVIGRP